MKKLLIVEDDITFSLILSKYLTKNNYDTQVVKTVAEVLQLLKSASFSYDLVLLDYHLPDGNALDVLELMRSLNRATPVLIMTSIVDVKIAVEAIKKGAREYITKPIHQEELLMYIDEAIVANHTAQNNEIDTIATKVATKTMDTYVTGNSLLSQKLYQHIALVANTDMTVLIEGESGTGKEHIARKVHELSERNHAPFIAIDCGALTDELSSSELFGHVKGAFTGAIQDKKGVFELAHNGTIFLDEIGNLSYQNQIKLLRVLQEKVIQKVGSTQQVAVNVRVVSATNENFHSALNSGSFREDLFHRLNEFKIKVPTLKERKEDLDDFVTFFIQKSNKVLDKSVEKIDGKVHQLFHNYSWPGNIRELQNVIKRAVLLAQTNTIMLQDLPEDMLLFLEQIPVNTSGTIHSVPEIKQANEQAEKELIIKTLIEVKFNKSKAARILKIDRTTLYNKMNKFGIDLD